MLPRLQQLISYSQEGAGHWEAELLRGHPEIRSLVLGVCDDGGSWPQQALASMPQLQRFTLYYRLRGADALLADLAACGSLRSIRLWEKSGRTRISGAGLAALAGAASSGTLESIVLDTNTSCLVDGGGEGANPRAYSGGSGGFYRQEGRVALADALPLLQARMPRLQALRVPVLKVGDEELRAVARQLGRPVEVLRAQLALDVEGAAA